MNTRPFKIAVLTAGLAAMPALSMAANSPAAMDSCVKAFMAQLSTTMTRTPKLLQSHFIDNRFDNRLGAASTQLTLYARDAHDNHPIARAHCTVNSSGQFTDLRPEPLYSVDPL